MAQLAPDFGELFAAQCRELENKHPRLDSALELSNKTNQMNLTTWYMLHQDWTFTNRISVNGLNKHLKMQKLLVQQNTLAGENSIKCGAG